MHKGSDPVRGVLQSFAMPLIICLSYFSTHLCAAISDFQLRLLLGSGCRGEGTAQRGRNELQRRRRQDCPTDARLQDASGSRSSKQHRPLESLRVCKGRRVGGATSLTLGHQIITAGACGAVGPPSTHGFVADMTRSHKLLMLLLCICSLRVHISLCIGKCVAPLRTILAENQRRRVGE